LPRRVEEEVLAQENQWLAGFVLDVLQRRKGIVVGRRGMAIRAVLAEAGKWKRVLSRGRPVRLPAAPSDRPPEPPVIGGLPIADHDGHASLDRLEPFPVDAAAFSSP